MKISKKKWASANCSESDYNIFKKVYRKCPNKLYLILVNDTSPASDHPLGFPKNPLEQPCFTMNIKSNDDIWWKIKDEQTRYNINKEAAKISLLSSVK